MRVLRCKKYSNVYITHRCGDFAKHGYTPADVLQSSILGTPEMWDNVHNMCKRLLVAYGLPTVVEESDIARCIISCRVHLRENHSGQPSELRYISLV